jgi:hypothetical protein
MLVARVTHQYIGEGRCSAGKLKVNVTGKARRDNQQIKPVEPAGVMAMA